MLVMMMAADVPEVDAVVTIGSPYRAEHVTHNFGASLEAMAQRLVQLANDKGGKDNISVILARVLKPFTARKSWYSRVFEWF